MHRYLKECLAIVESETIRHHWNRDVIVVPMTNLSQVMHASRTGQRPPAVKCYRNGEHNGKKTTVPGLVHLYAWAILDKKALEIIESHDPIVSVGCGNGYYEGLLRDRGCDVLAYDLEPPGNFSDNFYTWAPHTEVLEGDAVEVAAQHPDRTLFMCWPSMDLWAFEALVAYRRAGGRTLIYVGEGNGGCNATEEFFEELDRCWTRTVIHDHPRWEGLNDSLEVYTR